MSMEDRVVLLEREVVAIKSELAVLRHDFANTADLNPRVTRIELELESIRRDVTQLQKDMSQLQKDVARLVEDVVGIRIGLAKLVTAQSHFATKADLSKLEARLRGWVLATAFSILAVNFGMIYPLYSAMKPTPVVTPAPPQQSMPLTKLVLLRR